MAHMNVAVSEDTFRRLFELFRDSFKLEAADTASLGPIRLGYDVKAHLENGTVELNAAGEVQVKELDLQWDRLKVMLGLDIPEICVGGWCVNMPWPIPDFCLPRWCVFSGDPDISIAPDLAAFVRQEISFTGILQVEKKDATHPVPVPPFPWLRQVTIPAGDAWLLYLKPGPIDLDLFDFADAVGDLLEELLVDAVTAIIPGGWVRDLILAIIGGIIDLIRAVLDLPDDIEEWLSDQLNVSFGLLDMIMQFVGDFFARYNPLYAVETPLEIMAGEGALPAVKIPIAALGVAVNDDEMTVTADIG